MTDDPRKRTAIAICEDDTVPLGRPPGVPPDLGARTAAGLRALFARFSLAVPHITTGTDDAIVDVDLSVRLTAREVERLEELVAKLGGEIVPHPSTLDPREVAVREALSTEWQTAEALAAACKLDHEDTLRILRALKRRGMAWDVGGQWRVP